MKKFILTALIILAIAAGAYLILRPKENKKVIYQTSEVKKGTINKSITATGTIEPITQVEVGTQVSGTISRIYVDYNSVVTKGQKIAELDRTLLESELASQNATLESNKSEYEYQLKNHKRISGLYEKQLVSATEMESAQNQYDKARRAYEKSQSDLVKAKTNLGYATIYSPIDGVVLSRAVDEGQTVASSFNTPTLFTIANDLQKMQVIANVDETDIGQIEVGQRVVFEVSAFRPEKFEGSVTQIRLQPTTTSNVVTYEVVINAPNPDLKLKPGLTADVEIFTLYKENILLVPSGAFTFQDKFLDANELQKIPPLKQGEKTVWIQTESGISPVNIQTGSADRVNTEVLGGIKTGERVAVGIQVGKPDNNGNNGETNPFMPARPGQRKR